jgi:ABC-type sugar transport system permease subunit
MSFAKLRDPSEKTLALLLLAPAFLLIALIVVYPIGKLIFNSFFDLRLSGGTGEAKFVGFENYLLVWQDTEFWNAAKNTVLITLITVPALWWLVWGLRCWRICRSSANGQCAWHCYCLGRCH